MQVRDRMTPTPVTLNDDASFEDALHLMKEKNIRRLPIFSRDGHLVGIVAETDLFSASPSRVSSLSIHEMHYLLLKLKVKEIMTKRVIAVDEDCPLEEAARIMVDHKIGCLPVLRDDKLVGIITETDIFRTFVEVLGGREKGLRLTLDVTEGKGVLAAIAEEIVRQDGNILSLATFFCKDEKERIIMVKVTETMKEPLIDGMTKAGVQVLNAVEMTGEGHLHKIIDEKYRPFVKI